MVTRNTSTVINNPYQGNYPHILCVCSAGCLRSPTAAVVLAEAPYNFNTRSAGLYDDISIVPVTETLLAWADEIVCMEEYHTVDLARRLQSFGLDKKIINLGIPDNYEYRNPELMQLIKTRYDERAAS